MKRRKFVGALPLAIGGALGVNARSASSQTQASGAANVKSYGAVGDGTTNDTVAVQSALNSASKVYFPAGNYMVEALTIPSNVVIIGDGSGSTIISAIGSIPMALLNISSAKNIEISHIQFADLTASYPNVFPLALNECSNVYIHDLIINPCAQGIWTNNCTDCIFQDITVLNPTVRGIQHNGGSSARIKTVRCQIVGAGVDHGIQAIGGIGHIVSECSCTATAIFGINMFNVRNGIISQNVCYDTTKEGINIEDCSYCTLFGNFIYWTGTLSQDFGLSVYGTVGCNFNNISGNQIQGSYKSGIALASNSGAACQFNTVIGNTIVECNRNADPSSAGVILYGDGTAFNFINDNSVYDYLGNTNYGVNEWNTSGAGDASSNRIYGNKAFGMATDVTAKNPTTTEGFNRETWKTYIPAMSTGSGTLTSASAIGNYYEIGKMIWFQIVGTITTNGTGATSVNFSLPYPNNAIVQGNAWGRENAITGFGLSGVIGTGSAIVHVFTHANGYPGVDSASISISGCYQRA